MYSKIKNTTPTEKITIGTFTVFKNDEITNKIQILETINKNYTLLSVLI